MAKTAKSKYSRNAEDVAKWAKALAHPARVEILKVLASTEGCYCGHIVNELPLAQATVSQHLKKLKEGDLIVGNVDGPAICYCVNKGEVQKMFATFASLQSKLENCKRC